MSAPTVASLTTRLRELEERYDALRQDVSEAVERFQAGEPAEGVFRELDEVVGSTRSSWDPDRCITKAWEWYEKHREPPASINWNPGLMRAMKRTQLMPLWLDGEWPSARTIIRLFGTWNAFIFEAGFQPREQGHALKPGAGRDGPKYDGLPEWAGWTMIPYLRSRAGISSQAGLAEVAGLSPQYIYKLESGRQTNPTVRVVLALARAMDVQAALLLETDPA